MDVALTPRDIQLRIRSGESLADVVAVAGLPADRVEAFAAPILAEREHTTSTALASPVRRRGETASARRLRQTVAESLLEHGQDVDNVTWDSWRRSDGRWIVQGAWRARDRSATARFLFDPKGRFSVADNDQARLLIGDLPVRSSAEPDGEPTVRVEPSPVLVQSDLGEETTLGLATPIPAQEEDSVRSDLDLLYDMISTIDEDSVRIFRGLREPLPAPPEPDEPPTPPPSPAPIEPTPPDPAPRPPKRARKRASVPSWDDIIFGGQS